MSEHLIPDPLQEPLMTEVVVPEETEGKRRAAAGWLISAAVHALVVCIAALAVFSHPRLQEADTPPTRISAIEPPAKPVTKPPEKRELEAKIVLDAPSEVDTPSPVNTLDTPVEIAEREADSDSPEAKGREEAIAEAETGGSGAFMAIGAGGGSSGMFGNRSGGGRKRAVGAGGGSKGSEGAVEASLRWFKRHQSPDGTWDAKNYYLNCTEGAKCEPGSYSKHAEGELNVHAAMTGYAVLCFLGAGYDHKTPNKYRSVVKKGLDYLLSIQKPDGLFGARNYEHPIATMALAEAYAMTADPSLRKPAQLAVDVILARQNRGPKGDYDLLGWDYTIGTKRNDNSVTGWNIMALKSALAGGLAIGKGMDGAHNWLDAAWKASNEQTRGPFKRWQDVTAYEQSRFSYVWQTGDTGVDAKANYDYNPDKPATAHSGRSLESIGLVSGVFCKAPMTPFPF